MNCLPPRRFHFLPDFVLQVADEQTEVGLVVDVDPEVVGELRSVLALEKKRVRFRENRRHVLSNPNSKGP